jgi:hypothetical protein
MRRTSSRVVALALAAGVVLSACSSTDRSAAPAEEKIVTEQVTESVEELANEPEPVIEADQDSASDSDADAPSAGEASPELDADPEGERAQVIVRGVRVCVINERTTRDRRTAWIDVKFTKVDRVSRESTFIAPGDQICGEASYVPSMFTPDDLKATITTMYDDTATAEVGAVNHIGDLPSIAIEVPDERESSSWYCYVDEVNGTKSMDDEINRFTLRRLPDSTSFKEFTITVSDGQSRDDCDSARNHPNII